MLLEWSPLTSISDVHPVWGLQGMFVFVGSEPLMFHKAKDLPSHSQSVLCEALCL